MKNVFVREFDFTEECTKLLCVLIDGKLWVSAHDAANCIGFISEDDAVEQFIPKEDTMVVPCDVGDGMVVVCTMINEHGLNRLMEICKDFDCGYVEDFEDFIKKTVVPQMYQMVLENSRNTDSPCDGCCHDCDNCELDDEEYDYAKYIWNEEMKKFVKRMFAKWCSKDIDPDIQLRIVKENTDIKVSAEFAEKLKWLMKEDDNDG